MLTTAVDKLHSEEDAAEFDAAIHDLDELSVLLYYPDILPRVVFSDPQVFLDKVTELVLAQMSTVSESKALGINSTNLYSSQLMSFSQKDLVSTIFLGSWKLVSITFLRSLKLSIFKLQLFKKAKLLIFAKISDAQSFVPALFRDLSLKILTSIVFFQTKLLLCNSLTEVQERASFVLSYAG